MADIKLILTVPDAKVADFKAGLLAHVPVPVDDDGNPTINENAWIKQIIIDNIKTMYRAGKEQLFEESNKFTFDPDVIS